MGKVVSSCGHTTIVIWCLPLSQRHWDLCVCVFMKVLKRGGTLTCSSTTAWTAASGNIGLPMIVWVLVPNMRTLFNINCNSNGHNHESIVHSVRRKYLIWKENNLLSTFRKNGQLYLIIYFTKLQSLHVNTISITHLKLMRTNLHAPKKYIIYHRIISKMFKIQ